MIITLKGRIERMGMGEVRCETNGVGYHVHVPVNTWESLNEDAEEFLWIHTYVREDRFDLFGFSDKNTRTLFGLLIGQSGIGPRTALELCAVPRELLAKSANDDDITLLTGVKGIGKKTAEKLLVEIRSLMEKQPDIFNGIQAAPSSKHEFDQDAISALRSLGYDGPSILEILKSLPDDLATTEDRVAAALRSL